MLTKTYLAYLMTLAASMPTPGPAMLQAMTLGMRHGARPVAAAALGNACATVLQVTAILFGLSLLAREPVLLRLVGFAGAAYLVYLLTLAVSMPTPGPATLQAMTLGMRHGSRPAAAAAFGNACAASLQVTAILFGLSLLAREPILLRLVGFAGTAYLVWLGLRLWRAPCRLTLPANVAAATRLPHLFGQGLLVAAVNPKAWGFLSAMLPPFAASGMPDAADVFLLVAPVCLIGFGGMMAYAVFGAWLVRVLDSPAVLRRAFRAMAVVLWACAGFFAAREFPL